MTFGTSRRTGITRREGGVSVREAIFDFEAQIGDHPMGFARLLSGSGQVAVHEE